MKNAINLLRLCGLLVILNACHKDKDEPSLEIKEIGFVGTTPKDSIKFNNPWTADNGLDITSISNVDTQNGFTYVGRVLLLRSEKINIQLSSPFVKGDNKIVDFGGESLEAAKKITAYGNEKFPYSKMKEVFAIGDKIISNEADFNSGADIVNFWSIQIWYNKYYKGFITDGRDQTGSTLKVVDLIEGSENDPEHGQLKTLEVILKVDVKLYLHDLIQLPDFKAPSVGKLKGLLRLKYKEKK